MRLPVSTHRSRRLRQQTCARVLFGIVERSRGPHLPEDPHPGTSHDTDRVRMSASSGSGCGIDTCSPFRSVSRVVSPGGYRSAKAVITGPAEDHGTGLAALASNRSNAGLSSELIGGTETLTNITDLDQDLRRVELSCPRKTHEESTVGKRVHLIFDVAREDCYLLQESFENTRQGQHQFAERSFLQRPGTTCCSRSQTHQHFGGGFPARVTLASQEGGHAFLSEMRCTAGRRIAPQERQCDGRVDLVKELRSARPEALQNGSQLIRRSQPLCNQIVTRSDESAQSLDLIRSGLKWPEPVSVCAEHISQQVSVTKVVLSTGCTVAWTACLDGVRMDRNDGVSGLEQSVNDQPGRTFDCDGDLSNRSEAAQLPLERRQAGRIVADLCPHNDATGLIYNTHCMTGTSPVETSEVLHPLPPLRHTLCAGESGGVLTVRRSWTRLHGATSCSPSRLPSTCHAADLMVAFKRPASKAVMTDAQKREVYLLLAASLKREVHQ